MPVIAGADGEVHFRLLFINDFTRRTGTNLALPDPLPVTLDVEMPVQLVEWKMMFLIFRRGGSHLRNRLQRLAHGMPAVGLRLIGVALRANGVAHVFHFWTNIPIRALVSHAGIRDCER